MSSSGPASFLMVMLSNPYYLAIFLIALTSSFFVCHYLIKQKRKEQTSNSPSPVAVSADNQPTQNTITSTSQQEHAAEDECLF